MSKLCGDLFKNKEKEGAKMRTQEIYTDYLDHFKYSGNTEIERIRVQGEKVVKTNYQYFTLVTML
jgi:hypothetical protein